jgi:hypothetical protein
MARQAWEEITAMPDQIRTVSELAAKVTQDPQLAEQLRADPAKTLAGLAAPLQAVPNDVWIYRIVVGALGLAVLIAITGAIVLAFNGVTEPPAVLTALGSAAVGALAGLLAPSPVIRG